MKYILNWPSGGGGDFILALIALAKGWNTEIIHLHRLNMWNHRSDSVLQYRTFKYYDNPEKQQEIYNSMPDDHILQTHTLNRITLDTKSNECTAVNLYASNIYQQAFIGMLHRIKTEPIDDNVSMNIENAFIEKAINIDYHLLFGVQYEYEIEKLFRAFNCPLPDVAIIQNMLKLYHEKNIKLLTSEIIPSKINRKAFYNIASFDEMMFYLEQPFVKDFKKQGELPSPPIAGLTFKNKIRTTTPSKKTVVIPKWSNI